MQSPFIHPSSTMEGGKPISAGFRLKAGISSTSHKLMLGLKCRDKHPFILTFTPKDNVESSGHLPLHDLDYGRKLEDPERTHGDTGRTWSVHTEEPLGSLNPETSSCAGTVLTTATLCRHFCIHLK